MPSPLAPARRASEATDYKYRGVTLGATDIRVQRNERLHGVPIRRMGHKGEVSEWSNEPVLKTGVAQATVGSNPTLSAK